MIARIIQILGLNGVPAAGWFGGGWTEGTVMAVYWTESILMALLVALRISWHWRKTRKAGHLQGEVMKAKHSRSESIKKKGHPFLWGYLTTSMGFLIPQGVMLAVVLAMLHGREGVGDATIQLPAYLKGMGAVLVFLLFGFVLDVRTIASRPFAWIRSMAEHSMGRVFVFQFSILVGLPLLAYFEQPRYFFGVFVFLKTLMDFGIYLPSYNPKEPPRWLCALMDKIPPAPGIEATSFAEYWKGDVTEQEERYARDEEVVGSAQSGPEEPQQPT